MVQSFTAKLRSRRSRSPFSSSLLSTFTAASGHPRRGRATGDGTRCGTRSTWTVFLLLEDVRGETRSSEGPPQNFWPVRAALNRALRGLHEGAPREGESENGPGGRHGDLGPTRAEDHAKFNRLHIDRRRNLADFHLERPSPNEPLWDATCSAHLP